MDTYEMEIRADELASKIKEANGDLSSAYKQFEIEKKEIEKFMPIEAIIPGEENQSIGMALKTTQDGKSFWEIYSESITKKLCDRNGKLHDLATQGLASSAGAIVTAVASTLAFPPVALGLAVPIAAILATTSLEAFCDWTQEGTSDT